MKVYKVAFEEGEPIMLRLSDEQAAEWRRDPRVAKVTVEKSTAVAEPSSKEPSN